MWCLPTRRSPSASGQGNRRLSELPFGMQNLSADLDRLGVDKDESDHARFGSAIDPIVDRAALHEHVAGLQVDDRVVELHIDLARHDDGIIDGIRPMNTRRDPGRKLDDAKDRAVL